MRAWVAYCLLLTLPAVGCNRVEVHPKGADGPRAAATRALPAGAPNLLLISIDTLRADHLGCYGAASAVTPNLDALAASGVRFEHAFTVAPLTLPAHVSLMTGLYPAHHGVRHNGLFALPGAERTLAEELSDAGYRTGAVIGSVVLARRYGLAQGFASYDDAGFRMRSVSGFLERRAEDVVDHALAWLGGAASPGGAPFFAWLHFFDPHASYSPPPPFAERFADRPYDGEIAYVDAQLGRLLQTLRASGQLANTLVAVVGDHGESLGEHGELTHGYTLYDATLRVPLILAGPGLPAGHVESGVVSLVDVAPTLLALLGRAPLASADGIDLSRAIRDAGAGFHESTVPAGPPERVAFAETLAGRYDHGWSELHAARSADHLFVRAPRPELYELAADPREEHNLLATGGAGEARVLAQRLDSELGRTLERPAPRAELSLDETSRAQLQALGYALPSAPVAAQGTDPKDGLAALRLYWAAGEAFDHRNLAEARALARRAKLGLPASPELEALAAQIELEAGDPAAALAHAERARALEPRSARAIAFAGDALAALGRRDESLAAYDAALAVDPYEPRAHMGRLRHAAEAGDLDAAARYESEARARAPENSELLLALAFVWERLGQRERALERAREALALQPDFPFARMAAAIQLAALGRDAEAEAELAQAAEAAQDPQLRNRLAIAWAQAGRTDRARALFAELVARYPDYASPRQNLARLDAGK